MAAKMSNLTIALAGNPNAGKSTIFNALTGMHQHTGNWPGKTVELKSGAFSYQDTTIKLVDLPGTYSLAAFSPDEVVARDFIISAHPDVVICVVDATNLERNLYLAVQILELGVAVVIALNMADQAKALGINIDQSRLSELLGGVPIVPTAASKGVGIDQLLATAVEHGLQRVRSTHSAEVGNTTCQCATPGAFTIDYGDEIERAITGLSLAATQNNLPLNGYCSRWLVLKLLEGEDDIVKNVAALPNGDKITVEAVAEATRLESQFGDDLDILTADHRYSAISSINRQVSLRRTSTQATLTERIDTIVANRLLGLPVFLFVMYLVFRLVIDVSAPYVDWIDTVINGPLTAGITASLTRLGAAAWIQSLLIDGVVAGVGGVLTFVPGLIVLFLFLALLEDSGYMARAAFVMDRFMQRVGLHGKSVIPLMLGFGCAVPAVYATRTIANRRDRLLTALLVPFMSCAARLPVYLVFAMAFFGSKAGTVIWLLYLLGVIVAILVGLILSRFVLKPGENSAFVMELPPYRMPTINTLAIHTWEHTRQFIRNAGTVILAISILLWFLLNMPWGVSNQEDSYYGQISAAAPLMQPAGFGSYETSGALITGFIAKEMVVSTLSQVYTGEDLATNARASTGSIGQELIGVVIGFAQATADSFRTLISLIPGVNLIKPGNTEETALSLAIRNNFTPLSAVAFLVFVLLYVPCMATIGAIKQEFGGRWAASAAVYQTVVAWLFAVLVFQGGRLLGIG